MIGKTDWTRHLHEIRKREIDIVFSLLPSRQFFSGLEIGAGDGYQTTLLAPHLTKLISSDLNFKRIKESLKLPHVEYKSVDADSIKDVFEDKTFDFIFSSNVLEHLRNPGSFLRATQPMLTEDGVAVHIIPSRHIKFFYLLLYYPHMILLAIDRLIGKLKGKAFFQGASINLENNINAELESKGTRSRLKRFIFPSPHGNFSSHTKEFIAFGRKRWESLFREAGYRVVAYRQGPVFSGYGFGLNFLRKLAEYTGISSEHIFVLKKVSDFELKAWEYTNNFLPRGSMYEKEKFVGDWMRKEKNAKTFVQDFTNAISNPRGKKVLDIGFGNGIMLKEFANVGAVAYGLETENVLMGLATKRFEENNLHANLHIYDGKSFPFDSNTFDYAYSTSVLEHMTYPEDVLNEISRTLIPGGRFYLSFPNKYAPKESHTGLWFISWLPRSLTQYILKLTNSSPLEDWNLHFVSYFSLKNMATKAGLRIVYDTNSPSYFKGRVKKILASVGIHYGILLKTIILVLEKPKN
jgi:2-polyprenyl-3-methyl-5-hydroxy-6-metoxy-1,4-benzoquinol methylase